MLVLTTVGLGSLVALVWKPRVCDDVVGSLRSGEKGILMLKNNVKYRLCEAKKFLRRRGHKLTRKTWKLIE